MQAVAQLDNTIYVSSYYYICVLIPLYLCPHTPKYVADMRLQAVAQFDNTIYVSSYYYICVLILLYMCHHITIILLYMCPHTSICLSSYS
jgi:hypothetical protein